jgi:non-ribosomal peptide synthetase component E (peptide arylation enzyme)
VTNHWASKKTFQDIDIFSDNDLTQILDWNTASSVSAREPVNATLLDSIQTIAQNVGGCLALGSSERTVSYADLVRLSDVLATKLLQHGLQVASYLLIVSHKSISAVVAMLAA